MEPEPHAIRITVPRAVTLPTLILAAAISGGVGYAIGNATTSGTAKAVTVSRATPVVTEPDVPSGEQLPAGHPAVGGMAANAPPSANPSTLVWTAPPRWASAPNTSSMRIATYKIPHAPGDSDDAEMSVTQAGGSVDANIDRWIGQFGESGQKNVKRTRRKVSGLAVEVVEIQGTYASGMDPGGPKANWALLGAIAETPDMPHFFKMTGPARTVMAARPELDALVSSFRQ